MRSPFAAELTRARLGAASGRFAIGSAGTDAANGRRADPRAITAAARYGISLESHRARRLTPELVVGSDLICVMDYRNEAEAVNRFPLAAEKIVLLGGIDSKGEQSSAIPDPYMLEEEGAEPVYDRLSQGVDALVRQLLSK
jgi:protein-tyrosine phosphatase